MSEWIANKFREQQEQQAQREREQLGQKTAVQMYDKMLLALKEHVAVDVAAYCRHAGHEAAKVTDNADGGFVVTCGPRTVTVHRGEGTAITWAHQSSAVKAHGIAHDRVEVAADSKGDIRYKQGTRFVDAEAVSRVILEPVLFGSAL
jgi:hypothetical protein